MVARAHLFLRGDGGFLRDISDITASTSRTWRAGICSRIRIPGLPLVVTARKRTLSHEIKQSLATANQDCIPTDHRGPGDFFCFTPHLLSKIEPIQPEFPAGIAVSGQLTILKKTVQGLLAWGPNSPGHSHVSFKELCPNEGRTMS